MSPKASIKSWVAASIFLLVAPIASAGEIIYVDPGSVGANNGSSWPDAYNYLQDALTDANSLTKPVEIRVAQGVYTPDRGAGITPGDRYVTFQLINGVTLKGGYAGAGTADPNARDFELYETILSGDLARNDVDVTDPRYMRGDPTRFENSNIVVTGSGTDTTAILEGFTITGGNPYGHWLGSYGNAGGMYNKNGNPMVVDCSFNKNAGTGMFNIDSNPTIIRCRFSLNSDRGMSFTESNPIVTDCIFSRNSSGGMYIISNSSATLTNCIFIANSAYFGGGITCSGNTTMTNCVFIANYAQVGGGGMGGGGTLTNCTFIANWASGPGGGISGSTVLTNCILWGNMAPMGPQIALPYGATVTVSYSNVQGGQAEILNEGSALVWGDGNIDADPFFVRNPHPGPDGEWDGVDDDFGDLRLVCSSPCVNTGNNITEPPLPATDFDGNPRIIDRIVDMGAYEGGNQAFVVDGNPVLIREGTTAMFTVALACDPVTPINVTVGNYSGDKDIAVESGAALTFDSTNFWIPQTVVLAAAEDADHVEDFAKIRISASGISFAEVIAWEIENDVNPVLFVDVDASGANDGSSWPDAFKLLQDAMTVAAGAPRAVNEIWVAQGIYTPDRGDGITPGDREATFQLINSITIKGGYAGCGEPDPNVRDIELHETILSGDLSGDDVDVNDPRDLREEPSRADNSYHVVTSSGTDETAVLDGFTITGGNANSDFSPDCRGAGVRNYSGSPTLTNCTITTNSSSLEGSGMLSSGSPTLTNCTFSNNCSHYWGGGLHTSGWYSKVTLINCTFSGNFANSEGGGLYAGYNKYGSPTLANCTFTANTSGHRAAGMLIDSDAVLTNCTFIGNTVDGYGGAIYNYSNSPILTNCVFIGNSATKNGGAVYDRWGRSILTNCTFSGNSADIGAGIYCIGEGNTTVINCIMWGNMATQGNQIALNNFWDEGILYPATITVRYSDVESGASEVFVDTGCTLNWGQGNIDADPLFVDANGADNVSGTEDDNLRLKPDSPCINAGDPNYVAEPNEMDLDGRPRIINGRIDMGAYEYSPPILACMDIYPNTLNLTSKGKWITAFFWLPEEYNVADIDPRSLLLEDEIEPQWVWLDEEEQIAMARFSREELQAILNAGDIELTITGQLINGTIFEGTDVIRVIAKGGRKLGK